MAGKTIKGITIEIDGNTTKLGNALKAITNESKSIEKQLKSVDAALKLDPTNTDLLATKQRLLSDQIENTQKHLELLRQAQEKAAASAGNYDAWVAAYTPIQNQIDKTKKKLTELFAEQAKMERAGEIDTEPYRKLTAEIDELEESLKALQKEGKAVTDQFGAPISTREYEQLQTEIVLTESKLKEARKEADRVQDALEKIDSGELKDVAAAADDAADALDEAGNEAADFGDILKANVIADGAKAIVDGIKNVVEETKEYQKIMGSLEVSSAAQGYTIDQTNEAYKRLYSILADDQSAATTVANLQALNLEQSDLLNLIDNVTGAWAKYGDSIPIDSLAESINETIKSGKVTGTFADVLNWGTREGETFGVTLRANTEANKEWNDAVRSCETAEDYFNLALQSCNNEAERSCLVTTMMTNQGLAPMAEAWRENNEALVENNAANADMQEQLGELGETMMPLTTMLTEMLTKLLSWFNGLDAGTQRFIVVGAMLLAVLLPILNTISSISLKIGLLPAIFGGTSTSILNLSGIFSGLGSVISGLASSVIGGLGSAFSWLAANPIVIVVLAIGTIIAALIYLWNNCEAFREFWINLWNAITTAGSNTIQSFSSFLSQLGDLVMNGLYAIGENGYNIITAALTGAASAVQNTIQSASSAMGQLKDLIGTGLNNIASSVTSGLQTILGKVTSWGSNLRSKTSSAIDGVRNAVSSGLDRIKSLFKFEWSLPRIKLPHFYISGRFSLNPPSVPSFGVQWYAKGGILSGAQIFGSLGSNLLGGGEAGPEAVLPLSSFYSELRSILGSFLSAPAEQSDLSPLYRKLDDIYNRLARLQIVLDSGALVGETVDQMDAALAERQQLAARGV